MEAITLEDVVRVIGPKLKEDNSLLRSYDIIVRVLKLLFENEDIEAAFRLDLSEEEVIEYAKKEVLSTMKDQMTQDDIYKIEIVSDSPKKLLIVANAHFSLDESYSCRDAELAIKEKIEIFTGYNVKIRL
ncbi:MAG: hypothetical protein IKG14_01365 [Clostridia bacterium]|nr:hypothetical protein [Clostridia bacterium]